MNTGGDNNRSVRFIKTNITFLIAEKRGKRSR